MNVRDQSMPSGDLAAVLMEPDQEFIPDEILVVSAILGDLGAFDELVKRYGAAVLRMAGTMLDKTDAEDVAQEVWLLAFKALPSIDDPQKFGAWLMVITKNRARRAYSRVKRRAGSQVAMDALLLERLAALHVRPQQAIEEREALRTALDSMPEEYSIVLRMRFFDAIPLKRIASFLDAPISTVKWRIFRGKQMLRERLEELERTE